MESKKKNMMSSETEAPRGRHMACSESSVVTLLLTSLLLSSSPSPTLSSMARERKEPYTISRMEMKKVDTREESMME
jgi:hypothetical protein